MHEEELYERLLGLSAPLFVAEVKLDGEAQKVDVFIEHAGETWYRCTECGKSYPIYHHTAER